MNNKIVSAILIAGIASTGFAWISSANNTSDNQNSTYSFDIQKGKKMRGFDKLSDEEKTLIENMDETEKKEFFQQKKEESKAMRDLKESVIDDLLAGNTLTAEQENIRAEIITQRAEKKAKQIEREEQREVMKAIKQKKKSWEELTSEEQELLETFKEKHKGKKQKRGGKSHK